MSLIDKVKMVLGIEEQSVFIRPLKAKDLPMVLDIEESVYGFPWSQQIFKDCLSMGYSCWALISEGELIAYTVLSIAAGEAHILNICVHPEKQGKGFGRLFLQKVFAVAKDKNTERVFLEVRPSNTAAIELYKQLGFEKIGQRKAYYPTKDGREDALVYSVDLKSLIN